MWPPLSHIVLVFLMEVFRVVLFVFEEVNYLQSADYICRRTVGTNFCSLQKEGCFLTFVDF
ncbi:hypothetical protein HanIR_Chr10g0497361 [Helianthus annuus]|nr:hypothetical protein HanIR_Chr10g0497361 [Helianthus annuus]